ncbi:apolipoprotein N-acyltransferase [Enterovirga aerilata]|uniref:Apolipoprotein N-acyltransferase n=1 Tax=Enterovirga aerilata TaxID=2730920 RepID=A0A849IKD5_9HYPH|nr:apolipoprotein N-acyltransferase [Enterovirga sp. DB1703]NNM74403.1 apolipoprotein N-acyltransferase [Enterovirga sp. DB1703]
MRAIADRMVLAEGWGRGGIAFAAGALGALAMPPFGLWPALAVSLSIAVWLIDGSGAASRWASLRRAAAIGWVWGFGYFLAGLWWIGAAFLVQADVFAWLMPFGVLGLPALLAVFPAVGFGIARLLWSPTGWRLFAFAFGVTVAEWLRGHAFTGFPWNTLGMALGQNLWLMQSASLVGLYGLTAIAVVLLSTPALLGTGEGRAGRLAPVLAAALALASMAGYGAWRLSGPAPAPVAGVKLRIVQPNLAQDAKFHAGNGPAILRRYLELSDRATSPETTGLADATHIIWPESAFPFLLHREPAALAMIADSLPRGGVLVTGAARSTGEGQETRYYNSIQAVGDTGAVLASYDKVHLVPFGEYVPDFLEHSLRAIGIREFVAIPGGFTAGERHTAFAVPGLPPVAGSVCYEAIFPGETMPPGPRPGLILNVTNDGWFGDTPGPRQHFAQARLRAVERGIPLVRAANTGISAVVDPYGRILASLPVGREGVIDTALPGVANVTVFDDVGNTVLLGLCFTLFLVAVAGPRRRSR